METADTARAEVDKIAVVKGRFTRVYLLLSSFIPIVFEKSVIFSLSPDVATFLVL